MDSRKKIKCGVAGVGYLGQHHARIYQALPTSDLVGVYDLNEEEERGREVLGGLVDVWDVVLRGVEEEDPENRDRLRKREAFL